MTLGAGLHRSLTTAIEHQQAGRLREAESIYRDILASQPNQPDALHMLGLIAFQVGQFEPAIQLIGKAIDVSPNVAQYHGNLAAALLAMRKFDESIAAARNAIGLRQNYPEALSNLAIALRESGQVEEALATVRRALEFRPNYANALANLGLILQGMGRSDEAIEACRNALALQADFPNALNNLGMALRDKGQLDEAIAAYRRAIAVNPNFPEALNNLGNAYKDAGRLDEAIESYERALQAVPNFVSAHINLVYTLQFHANETAMINRALLRWNRQHAQPLAAQMKPHDNDRNPDRRLRVGFVSPDFRQHPIGRFMLPLIEQHDRQKMEIVCYASVLNADAITNRLRAASDRWESILAMPDEKVVQRIRDDRIDILVDLTMHMSGSRLLVFARKPAPVQITYLAYSGSTGLETIDYRLTDPHLDPPGEDQHFVEKSLRLPHSYWCFEPAIEYGEVGPLPARSAGHVTFACLNNFCKVSPAALQTWSKLLSAVPTARLLLHTAEGSHRQRIAGTFESGGVDPSRIEFLRLLPFGPYLEQYRRIDIALDPFPYAGGTTTCDALWQGVPVVTLRGRTAVGRGGVSLLSNIGLPELIADTSARYVEIAAKLADDLPRLESLRAGLRDRMRASPLMDAPGFARDFEAVLRDAWRRFCQGRQ